MKRPIRLAVAGGAVVALVALLVLLQNREPAAPGESFSFDSSERVTFHELDRNTIEEITIVNPDGELTILANRPEDDGPVTFTVDYPFDVAFVPQNVNRIVTGATRMSSRRVIGDVDDLSAYGLDEPQATVEVATTDGTALISVGNQTPGRDAYYVQSAGDPLVYTVFDSTIRPFFATLDSLRLRVIPPIDPMTLESIVVETLEGERIRVRRRLDTEVDPEYSLSALLTVEPYARFFQTNTTWIEETVIASYTEASIRTFVDDDPADLSAYGLAPPVARVAITDAQTEVELLIGDQAGGGRYAKFADQPSVFVISGIGPIIRSRPYDTISPFVLILNIQLIDRFVVRTAEAEYVGSIQRREVDGQEDPEESFFLNDDRISEDVFRDLYQWAIGLQVDAEGGTATTGTPVATVTYYFVDGSAPRSASFFPQSQNFLSVVRGGETEFVIARAQVERMIEAFEEAAAEL